MVAAMREMKESGSSWVGVIPSNWEMLRGKYVFEQKSDRGNTKSLVLLSPTQNYGVIPQDLYEELSGFSAVKLNEKTNLNDLKAVHKGAFVISLRSFQGGFEYSEYEGVVSPAYQVFYPSVKVNEGYYKYLFKDKSFIEKMNSYTMSLRDGKNIAFADFGRTYIPQPPIDEQKHISNYLDKKCANIDSITDDIEEQIKTLEEYKTSIITNIVNVGKMVRFKYIATIRSNLVNPSNYLSYLQIGPDSIEKNTGKLIIERTVEEAAVDSWNHLFFKGQIIYSKIRPVLNKVIIAPYDGLCSADMYPIETKQNTRFLKYAMLSSRFVYQVDMITRDRIKMPKINQDELGNIKVLIPELDEQDRIADYLDGKCAEIDKVIADKRKLLTLLDEYKKSLIYEYVTGKKEVPAT